MSFRFGLQSVLDMKLKELEFAETYELQLKGKIEALERDIERLRVAYLEDRDRLNQLMRDSEYAEAQIFELSLSSKKDQIMELLKVLNETKERLAVCTQLCVSLRKKTRGLEKMKEKKLLRYERGVEKRLQDEIDTRSSVQAWRRKLEGGPL